MKASLLRCVVLLPLAFSACVGPFAIMVSNGTLNDRSRFRPTNTGFAVVDATHEVTHPDGSVTVEDRQEPRLLVFLSAAQFDPELDLAGLTAQEQADLVAEVRRGDLLILQDLKTALVASNKQVSAHQPDAPTDEFTFFIQRGNTATARNADFADGQELGSRQTVTLQPAAVNLRMFGRIDFQPIGLTFEAGANQSQRPSVGSITIRASVPVLAERLGESNLDVLKRALKTPQ